MEIVFIFFVFVVYPHPGGAAELLPAGPRLRSIAAHYGTPRQAGVLHRRHEDPVGRSGAAVCCQKSQTDAAQVHETPAGPFFYRSFIVFIAIFISQRICFNIRTVSLHLCYCRTETVVEKMLTNWMSICLYSFLKVQFNTVQCL